jgi:hypothetical protein
VDNLIQALSHRIVSDATDLRGNSITITGWATHSRAGQAPFTDLWLAAGCRLLYESELHIMTCDVSKGSRINDNDHMEYNLETEHWGSVVAAVRRE